MALRLVHYSVITSSVIIGTAGAVHASACIYQRSAHALGLSVRALRRSGCALSIVQRLAPVLARPRGRFGCQMSKLVPLRGAVLRAWRVKGSHPSARILCVSSRWRARRPGWRWDGVAGGDAGSAQCVSVPMQKPLVAGRAAAVESWSRLAGIQSRYPGPVPDLQADLVPRSPACRRCFSCETERMFPRRPRAHITSQFTRSGLHMCSRTG
jgi:hypothetical protein